MPNIAGETFETREEWDPSKIAHWCWLCHGPHTIIVSFLNGTPTKTRTGICGNPACARYSDLRLVTTWAKE